VAESAVRRGAEISVEAEDRRRIAALSARSYSLAVVRLARHHHRRPDSNPTKQISDLFVEHADAAVRDEMADRARLVSVYALLASLRDKFHPIFPEVVALKTLVGRWHPVDRPLWL